MDSYVADTQALIKFMVGQKVIDEECHRVFLSADQGKNTIIIPAAVFDGGSLSF